MTSNQSNPLFSKKFIIVSRGNCFRSQYLEARMKGKGYAVSSCGLAPTNSIHPEIIQIFKERGVVLENLSTPSKFSDISLGDYDHVLSFVDDSLEHPSVISVDVGSAALPNRDKIFDVLCEIDTFLANFKLKIPSAPIKGEDRGPTIQTKKTTKKKSKKKSSKRFGR